jgi:hypothetical protein
MRASGHLDGKEKARLQKATVPVNKDDVCREDRGARSSIMPEATGAVTTNDVISYLRCSLAAP